MGDYEFSDDDDPFEHDPKIWEDIAKAEKGCSSKTMTAKDIPGTLDKYEKREKELAKEKKLLLYEKKHLENLMKSKVDKLGEIENEEKRMATEKERLLNELDDNPQGGEASN